MYHKVMPGIYFKVTINNVKVSVVAKDMSSALAASEKLGPVSEISIIPARDNLDNPIYVVQQGKLVELGQVLGWG